MKVSKPKFCVAKPLRIAATIEYRSASAVDIFCHIRFTTLGHQQLQLQTNEYSIVIWTCILTYFYMRSVNKYSEGLLIDDKDRQDVNLQN